ncbi:AMP-binding protein [Streptomyces sp. CC208A]|uniref:AMP-binding protein n=1 Tax=Streptomyces sp. CC208A TaxID=3044573 RepID=UPI0024A9A2CA|nr:AMP-binding protein [Streptomyces sp. CC208A]
MSGLMNGQDRLGRLLGLRPDDRTAVDWRGGRLTYAELDAAVDDLARALSERGAARTHVLVLGPLTPAYVVGLLAALRSGAVPVPVDAGLRPDQYAWAEQVARPSAVLSSDVSTAAHYRGIGAVDEWVLESATGRVLLELPAGHRARRVRRHAAHDAGYLIPTSGSTGAPKAVVGSRTGLGDFLSWFTTEFGLRGTDVCAAVTRVNFDPSLRELLAVLAVGGRLALPEVDAQLDLRALADHLVRSEATLAFLVPSLARRIADTLQADGLRLDHLRLGFFAGEVLPTRVAAQWNGIAPGAEFVNLYGMTEGTLAQLFRRNVQGAGDGGAEGVPVGSPRPGVSVAIDRPDADGRGEVLITSAAPALGTLAEDADGAETFRVDPMPRVLRTGDSGYLDEHGRLVVTGRLGNDLKVSGRRVSFHRLVDEIEELPGVQQCVVVDREGPQAFLAVADPTRARAEELRDAVHGVASRMRLPRPAVHLRGAFPLLRSGKVDRVALAASLADAPAGTGAGSHPVGDVAGAPPVTDVAGTLCGLLGLDSTATATTSFVDAGLTSLDMMEFVLEVNRRFATDFSVQDCFAHRDVASLSRAIERERGRAGGPATPSGSPASPPVPEPESLPAAAGDPDVAPLSTRQRAYMAVCMSDGNANWCNISREIRIARAVTPAEVAAAVDAVVARHDVLRLSLTEDWTRQLHRDAADVRCPGVLHDGGEADDGGERGHRARVQDARVRAVSELIDPTAAPPLRVVAVPGTGTSSVLVVAHHLFVDGLSLDLVADELRSLLTGRTLPDAPAPHGYRAYCRATERTAHTAVPEAAYWEDLLKGAGQTELPEAGGEGARLGELISRPFGVTGTRAAHRIAEARGVSVFAVVLAAFERAVSRTFGLGPLTLVVPVQVREGARAGTAGMFTSQLVVRGRGPDGPAERAVEFARQLEDGVAHSAWEFDQRAEALGLDGTEHFPLSTVLFNQHPKPRGLRARDLGAWRPRSLGRTLRYQLQGELQMSAGEMALTYYYRRGIAMDRPDVIDRLHADVLAALCEAGGDLDGA